MKIHARKSDVAPLVLCCVLSRRRLVSTQPADGRGGDAAASDLEKKVGGARREQSGKTTTDTAVVYDQSVARRNVRTKVETGETNSITIIVCT